MTKDNLEKESIKFKLGNLQIEEIYYLISKIKDKVAKDKNIVLVKLEQDPSVYEENKRLKEDNLKLLESIDLIKSENRELKMKIGEINKYCKEFLNFL